MDAKHRSGWSYAGEGLMWALIWLGFGGCVFLYHHDSKTPLVVIERAK